MGIVPASSNKDEKLSDRKEKSSMLDAKVSTEEIVAELKKSYDMELETVINYLANSVHLDGLLAMEIREALKQDVAEELTHATRLAERLKILGAAIPGSMEIHFSQKTLQPPVETTDVLSVVKGVIDAENGTIAQYHKIIEMCDGIDYVTQDMAIELVADEEKHRRDFTGFLKDLDHRPSLR
jgi:bacterioferritin